MTIHHWDPLAAGLAELRRVSRGPVVVFTFELDDLPPWQLDFLALTPAHGTLSTVTYANRRATTVPFAL